MTSPPTWKPPGEETLHPDLAPGEALEVLRARRVGSMLVAARGETLGAICQADLRIGLEIAAELGQGLGALALEISPNDAMFSAPFSVEAGVLSRAAYLQFGLAGLRVIRRSLKVTGRAEPRSILDLPCGHGRVLRFLRAAFPHADLTACDIDSDGVEFCRRSFGARGVVSQPDPRDIPLSGTFDLIWCGSLLTHLDAPLWSEFLPFFAFHLEPCGVLVFTTHGARSANDVRGAPPPYAAGLYERFERDGFAYANYPDQSDYGLSLSSPDWVATLLAKTRLRIVERIEAGWNDYQDVFVCT